MIVTDTETKSRNAVYHSNEILRSDSFNKRTPSYTKENNVILTAVVGVSATLLT